MNLVRNSLIFAFIMFLGVAFAQQKVAVLNSEDNGNPPLNPNELSVLTDKLRNIALKVLPKGKYDVMTMQTIQSFLGSQEETEKVCEAANGCIAKIGEAVDADYVGQAQLNRFGKLYTIKVEFYDVKKGTLIGSFTDESSEDINNLLAVIEKEAPDMFRNMQGVSSGGTPVIVGGIGNVKSASDYEFSGEKRYLASIITEPEGAALSIDGRPVAGCAKTPCKVTLTEGKFRIIAAMEQYEEADTTVTVKQNNQNIVIKLKPNFGVLSVKVAYIDGLGKDDSWQFTINNKAVSSWANRLSPGKYTVKLSHRCYEDISFDFGINKGGNEVFDMLRHIKLKKGGLILDAERNGEPVSEPVFVNEKRVGETPFSGTVPLCAEIKVGGSKVNVKLKHNEEVKHTAVIKPVYNTSTARPAPNVPIPTAQKATEKEVALQTGWEIGMLFGGSYLMMLNTIDNLYASTGGGAFIGFELYRKDFDFLHIGSNGSINGGGKNKDAFKQIYPNADSADIFLVNANAYIKYYPMDFLYLQGGIGTYNIEHNVNGETEFETTVVGFSIGSGLIGRFTPKGSGFYVEGLYNIVPSRSGGYLSINIGLLWFL